MLPFSAPSLRPPDASIGEIGNIAIPWSTFVQIVLEITIEAYKVLVSSGKSTATWEEDHFSINLEKCIRPVAIHKSIPFQVRSQVQVYTPEIEKGSISAKEAVRIDIQLWNPFEENNDRIYFAWEGKLLVDQRKDKKRKHLISKYITEGLYRFLDEEYSKDVDDAGMLGYVLVGEPNDVVASLNRSLVHRKRGGKFSRSDYLKPHVPINDFSDVYCSVHDRLASGKKIKIYHLFLKFPP